MNKALELLQKSLQNLKHEAGEIEHELKSRTEELNECNKRLKKNLSDIMQVQEAIDAIRVAEMFSEPKPRQSKTKKT